MKSMKKLMMLLVSCCLVLSMAMPVCASGSSGDTNIISDARDAILQVNTYYQPKDKTKEAIPLFGGTSFLVNEKMVITCWHNLHFDDAEQSSAAFAEELEKETGEPFLSNPNALTGSFYYEIVVKRDVVIKANIVKESREMDFAILELESQIYDRKILPLDDTGSAKETDNVFALGFPEGPIREKDVQYYTSADVVITSGIVSMIADVQAVPRIQHSAQISAGNSGGPLLNERGQVIGVNALSLKNDYFYATQIGEVISIMDSLGYEYTGISRETAAVPQTEEEASTEETQTEQSTEAPSEDITQARAQLQSAVDSAREVDLTKYTEESASDFNIALQNAESVLNNAQATPAQLQAAANDLSSAQLGLVESSGSNMMLVIAIAVAAAAVIVIIVVAVIASNRSKENQRKMRMNGQRQMRDSIAGGPVPPQRQANKGFNAPPQNTPPSPSEYGETGVLDAGAGETTVLSGGQMLYGYLIRKKTGEKIELKKRVFTIGKERSKVDYCINDNTSVSRVHAKFVVKQDGCYIVDQQSTNGTIVNGMKIGPLQETKLGDRDTVKLSDEIFEYHRS